MASGMNGSTGGQGGHGGGEAGGGEAALTEEVLAVLRPLLMVWIATGDVPALQALAAVIPQPEVLYRLDRAVVLAQQRRAALWLAMPPR